MAKFGYKILAVLALATAPFGVSFVQAQAQPQQPTRTEPTIEVFTAPSQRVELHFRDSGIVKKVMVKDGEMIKTGQVLMTLDDDIDSAELDRLKKEADSPARIQYYEAMMEVSRLKLEMMEKVKNTGAYGALEIEQARAEKIQAERQIDVAKLDHSGDKSKADQQGLKVDKMQLKAGWDGVVEKVGTWEGEFATPDKDKPSITLVKNDPCYVVVNKLKTAQVSQLKMGDVFDVKYPGEATWRQAKVIFIAPVADAKGDTQLVRLELPNPENRSTGLPIVVKLPGNLTSSSTALIAR